MSGLTGRFLTRDPIAGSIQRDFGYEKQVSATEIVELMRHAASANGTVISSELVGKVLSRVLHQLPLTNENEPSFHSKLRTYQNIYQFFNGSPAAGVDPEGEMFFCPCNYKVRLWPAIPAPRGVLMPFPTPGFCGWPCCSILPPTCLNFAWFRSNGIGAGVPWAITPIPGFDTCP